MRVWWLFAALVFAGCTTPVEPEIHAVEPTDFSDFDACPQDGNYTIPCDRETDLFGVAGMSEKPPAGWRCLTMWDERMDHEEFWPRWYTYIGRPAPVEGEELVRQHIGIYYDTRFDSEKVGGVIQLRSGDDLRYFQWEGGPSGFVELPVNFEQLELKMTGMMAPLDTTNGVYQEAEYAGAPEYLLDINGSKSSDVVAVEPVWSIGPWRGPGNPDVQLQPDAALAVQVGASDLYLDFSSRAPPGIGDSSNLPGGAHWGGGRGGEFVANLSVPELQIAATIQPYIVFDVHVKNVQSPEQQLALDYLCRCYGSPLTTVDGIKCLLGREDLPIRLESGDGSIRISAVDATFR